MHVSGLVLNKADGATLRQALTTALADPEPGANIDALLDADLSIGGDTGWLRETHLLKRVCWMHPLGPDALEGSQQLLPGLCMGGDLEALSRKVASGELDVASISPKLGICGWHP